MTKRRPASIAHAVRWSGMKHRPLGVPIQVLSPWRETRHWGDDPSTGEVKVDVMTYT